MRSAGATWYGPGLYGNHTACGQTLLPGTVGVAHRTLPCGTAIKFAYHGHYLVTRVIDRGPYTSGNAFDLTNGARRALGFEGVGQVRYAVALKFARHRR
jgi:rare lipoprotein A